MIKLRTMVAMLVLACVAAGSLFADEKIKLRLWRHETGDQEVGANIESIKRFNASQNKYEVVWETLPPGTYTESVTAASRAGDLPDIFDMDQPTVANFAWSGLIQPLDGMLDKSVLADLNEGGKGTYNGKLYSVGQFDVALTIFARKSVLAAHKIRIPTVDKPWTRAEFDTILKTLKASGKYAYPLDINAQWGGEWCSYGFSPMLQSFGGDTIDRKSYLSAEGVLNGKEAVAWAVWFQGLFTSKYVDPKPADDQAFIQNRAALHYTGSWSAADYTAKIGKDDLLFLPAVDFGKGAKIGSGSWQWGISKNSKNAAGAAAFINFIMQPSEVAKMSLATSLIPTTGKAADLTENYKKGGAWRVFYEYAKNFALGRPATPTYPVISSAFEKVTNGLKDGANAKDLLDDAVDAINKNIADNKGYGFRK